MVVTKPSDLQTVLPKQTTSEKEEGGQNEQCEGGWRGRTVAVDTAPAIFTLALLSLFAQMARVAVRQRVALCVRPSDHPIKRQKATSAYDTTTRGQKTRTGSQTIDAAPSRRALALAVVRVAVAVLAARERGQEAVEARRTLFWRGQARRESMRG